MLEEARRNLLCYKPTPRKDKSIKYDSGIEGGFSLDLGEPPSVERKAYLSLVK
jgi:hypothetical protein